MGAPQGPTAPIAGVVRAAGRPLAKIPLLIRRLSGAAGSVAHLVRSDVDGTFCWPEAPPGVYTVVAVAPGFSPAVHQILHRAGDQIASFVRFDLQEERLGVLRSTPSGALDPWSARAATQGDVLREVLPAEAPAPARGSSPADVRTASSSVATTLPVRASVSSVQGFAAEGTGARSQTAVEMRGRVGEGFRWGVAGAFQTARSAEGTLSGEGSRLAIDVLPGDDQEIRLSTRRHSSTPSRLAEHAVDWTAATGERSKASVSARLLNQQGAVTGSVDGLFAQSSSSLELTARYQTDLDRGRFVRVLVGYRTGDETPGAAPVRPDRETRIGGVAGIRLFDRVFLEGGGTGDLSTETRGITPELGLRLEAADGIVLYGFASRRFAWQLEDGFSRSYVGWDPAELGRATSALYRAGLRLSSTDAGSLEVEVTRRELGDNFQLIFDADAIDRLDTLLLLSGDVADELSSSVVIALARGLPARLSVQAGRVQGEGPGSLSQNDARYLVSGATVGVAPTGTSVGLRYLSWEQALALASGQRAAGSEAIELSVSQMLPIPLLETWGSEWRALFSLEVGRRDEPDGASRVNRRMAGGLSLAF